MMRRIQRTAWGLLVFLTGPISCGPAPDSSDDWSLAPGLKTRWAADVDPAMPYPEYPRPQMVREVWLNLNGLWEIAILPASEPQPLEYAEKILVP